MIVTHSRFLRYQEVLYQKILRVPYTIELEIVSVQNDTSSGFSLTNFVGDNPRTPILYKLQCLYNKEISNREREKYGLPMEVNGEIFLSPKQLVPLFGTYKLNWNKTKVHFEERIQVIDRIIYLESMYESCVGVQVFVKDALKGG